MSDAPCIVWFRQDLRLSDNPALHAAAQTKRPLLLLYLLDDDTPGPWRMGGASRWWLHHSLQALAAALQSKQARLILRRGKAETVLSDVIRESGATAIYWNRCYEPYAIKRDTALKAGLSEQGVEVYTFNAALMVEPWEAKTKTGAPFKVFTPFWRACLTHDMRAPLPAPSKLNAAPTVRSDDLNTWALTPSRPNWAEHFPWRPGEASAHKALNAFIDAGLNQYGGARDQMGVPGTSRLSAHLHYGEISPVQIRAAAGDRPGAEAFVRELFWREFSINLLYHFPDLPEAYWKEQFDRFPWRDDAAGLRAWQKGQTGYPVVDAGMRELWATGFMHNRARMIVASFLIKHLLIDWRHGERWFWDTLVDADLANNAASWQWVAGSGADAAPYFRIFNPVTQGERYDADGAYVRRWVPELAKLPNAFIHKPWTCDAVTLKVAGVVLGKTYPFPIVDHSEARARALAAHANI